MELTSPHLQQPAQADEDVEQAMDRVGITENISHSTHGQLSAETYGKPVVAPTQKERKILKPYSQKARLPKSGMLQSIECLKNLFRKIMRCLTDSMPGVTTLPNLASSSFDSPFSDEDNHDFEMMDRD